MIGELQMENNNSAYIITYIALILYGVAIGTFTGWWIWGK